MKFKHLHITKDLKRALAEISFVNCTPVQAATIPHILHGHDVKVQAQTGTGKTMAFLIPIFHLLCSEQRYSRAQSLILSPTRELAEQISSDAMLLSAHCDVSVATIIGGSDFDKQKAMLRNNPRCIIGTPGRVLDLIKRKELIMSAVRFLVLDEADRMLDMGFYDEVSSIISRVPQHPDKRAFFFSATLNSRTEHLAWKVTKHAQNIHIEPEQKTVTKVRQELYHLSKDEKITFLLQYLLKYKPKQALIFTNLKHKTEKIAAALKKCGLTAESMSGNLSQEIRSALIHKVKTGAIDYLVVTDIVARGLHISNLPLVVNFDLPEDAENYVHRIGRTARAGKRGKVISFACEEFVYHLPAIEQFLQHKIPVAQVKKRFLVPLAELKGVGHALHSTKRGGYTDNRSSQRHGTKHSNRSTGSHHNRSHGNSHRRANASPNSKNTKYGGYSDNRSRSSSGTHRDSTADTRIHSRSTSSGGKPHATNGQKPNTTNTSRAHSSASKRPQRTERRQPLSSMTAQERLDYYNKKYATKGDKSSS